MDHRPLLQAMRPFIKVGMNWLGGGVAVVSLLYFGRELHGYGPELGDLFLNRQAVLAVASVTLVYTAALFLLAYTWALLALPSDGEYSVTQLMRTYGRASIAKYLPGNVWHLAVRHFGVHKSGPSHGRLARSTVAELAMSAAAATVVGGSALLLSSRWSLLLLVSLLGVAVLAGLARVLSGCELSAALKASLACLGFFVTYAGCVAGCTWLLGIGEVNFWQVAGAGLVAWLAGFFVPGAPGGIGVREAAMLWLLSGQVDGLQAGGLVVALRVVTTLADGLFVVASVWLLADRRLNIRELERGPW